MEPLLPFRDGESKRAGRPSSRDGARDVCSKRLKAPADAADPASRRTARRGSPARGPATAAVSLEGRVDREVRVDGRLDVQLSEGLLLDLDIDDGSEVRGEEAPDRRRPVAKKPPGKPSIFSVRVPTADVADFGSSTGNDGGMIVGAALGVLVVEAMVWRRWWSSSAWSLSAHMW